MPLIEIKTPAKRCPTCGQDLGECDEWKPCCMKYLGNVFSQPRASCSHVIGYVNARCVQCGARDPQHKGK